MKPGLEVKISIYILSTIVFVRPCDSIIFHFLKGIILYYLSRTLVTIFLWLQKEFEL
jgi:hypothetical protein